MMFTKILCPVDFPDPSRHAVRAAAQLANDTGAEFVVAHAWESPRHPEYSEFVLKNEALAPVQKREEGRGCADALAALRKKAASRLRSKVTVPVSTRSGIGSPGGQTLARIDEDRTIDLVVMGSHGRTGIKRALLWSVAEKVVRRARSPVLVSRSRD